MKALPQLFDNNAAWVSKLKSENPKLFETIAKKQTPDYLWIGCSDSRVPAEEIVGVQPGELFVHRNIANLVVHSDLNCLSVIQYAVDILKIKHILVCGHYGCGGVTAAVDGRQHGLVDNWLGHVRDIQRRNQAELDAIQDPCARLRRLCELNIIEQVVNVGNTTVVQDAWKRGEKLAVHGWAFDISDGLLRDLNVCIMAQAELEVLQNSSSSSPYCSKLRLF